MSHRCSGEILGDGHPNDGGHRIRVDATIDERARVVSPSGGT